MKSILKVAALLAAGLLSATAHAIPTNSVWNVSDAAGNCNGGPHGLWTNNMMGSPSCDANYFSIAGTLTLNGGTANLVATAINPDNVVATIDLTFGGFTDDHTSLPLKNGGGATAAQQAEWIFYTTVGGTIDIAGVGSFDALSLTGGHGLQIGWGANDKSGDFGASVWLNMSGGNDGGNHWDINMDLTRAPAPAIVLMLGTGLFAFGLTARRRV